MSEEVTDWDVYTGRLAALGVAGGHGVGVFEARQNAEAAQAAVAAFRRGSSARLNVEWTRVTVPMRGGRGRMLATPGNLISGGNTQATLLTTITSTDPINCYNDADKRTVRR